MTYRDPVPIGFLVPGPNGETETESRRYNWVWYRTAVGPIARDEVLTDLEDRIHPYSLPPRAVSGRARERLVDHANRLLPRSFAAAVEATARPFLAVLQSPNRAHGIDLRFCLARRRRGPLPI